MAPAIEIAIALAAAFWVVSLVTSAAVEWVSQNVLKKRSEDLNTVIGRLLDDKSADDRVDAARALGPTGARPA